MKARLINIREIARLIFLEGFRRHTILGLAVLAIATEASGFLFMDFFGRDLGNPVNDFIFSIMWFVGFVFIFFHAVQIMAWDVERGFIFPLLARPVSRTDYVIGVFAGLSALLACLQLLLGILGFLTLIWIKGSVAATFFPELSVAHYLYAFFSLLAYQLLLIAVVMLLSSAIRGSFPVLVLSFAYYGIASGLPVVRSMLGTSDQQHALQYILTLLAALFPNPSTYDLKADVLTVASNLTALEIAAGFGSAFLYMVIALWLACLLYGRRDLS
ncbi:MAG TPA: ABC transporter permease subunit [Mariprofundaceae bacterium]|nr:ABC transporter permease subunit [Mariprofundaceae bacterium]